MLYNIPKSLPQNHKLAFEKIHNSLESKSFPQAVLLTGERGVGKIRLACEIARLLTCTGESKTCGQCFSCKSWHPDSGQNPWTWLIPKKQKQSEDADQESESSTDLICDLAANPWKSELMPEEAYISVSDVRNLIKNLGMRESFARVVIIPEVDRMNIQAANAFLKTLEEVPSNTYFILTSSRPTALLPTILSRALKISVPIYTEDDLVKIVGNMGLRTPSSLYSLSGGSVTQALNWISNSSEDQMQSVFDFLRASSMGVHTFYSMAAERGLPDKKEAALQFLDSLFLIWGDFGRCYSGISGRLPYENEVQSLREFWANPDIYALLSDKILKCREQILHHTSPVQAIHALGYIFALNNLKAKR